MTIQPFLFSSLMPTPPPPARPAPVVLDRATVKVGDRYFIVTKFSARDGVRIDAVHGVWRETGVQPAGDVLSPALLSAAVEVAFPVDHARGANRSMSWFIPNT